MGRALKLRLCRRFAKPTWGCEGNVNRRADVLVRSRTGIDRRHYRHVILARLLRAKQTLTCPPTRAEFYLRQFPCLEEFMLKVAFVGAAALAIIGSSLVYSQQRARPGG